MKMNKEVLFEIIRFIFVGSVNTLNYYVLYLIALRLLLLNYLISHLGSFLISFIISFFLNCYFVYKVKPTIKKFLAFPLTQIVNITVQTLLMYIMVSIWSLSATLAPIFSLIVTVPITFLITKFVLKDVRN